MRAWNVPGEKAAVVAVAGGILCAAAAYTFIFKQNKTRPPRLGTVIPIVSPAEYVKQLKRQRAAGPSVEYYAMYSSYIDGIVTEPALMNIPLDDHMVHRGHGVFDTATLVNGKLYRLDIHVERLVQSAKMARIELPFPVPQLKHIIAQTCSASGQQSAMVRFWVTAGPGDFGFTPYGCKPCFYVLVFGGLPGLSSAGHLEGIHEVTVEQVPMKPPALSAIKSTNYLLNCLAAMEAHDKGGSFGIWVDEWGKVAEACVKNVCFVDRDNVLRTPAFEGVLAGTTVRRIMQVAQEMVEARELAGVVQGDILATDARLASEMFMSGGDTHITPVTQWDGRPVGSGRVGPVFKKISQRIADECEHGASDEHTVVSYVH